MDYIPVIVEFYLATPQGLHPYTPPQMEKPYIGGRYDNEAAGEIDPEASFADILESVRQSFHLPLEARLRLGWAPGNPEERKPSDSGFQPHDKLYIMLDPDNVLPEAATVEK